MRRDRGFGSILCALLVLLAAASPAQSPLPEDFAISGGDGEVLGWQRTRDTGNGTARTQTIERLLTYTVDGHQPTRSETSLTLRLTGERWDGFDYVVEGPGLQRRFRIGLIEGEATVENLTRGGTTLRQAIDPALPLAQPELLAGLPVGAFQTFDPGRGRIVRREGRFVDLAGGGDEERQLYLISENGQPIDGWIVTRDSEARIASAVRPNFSTPLRFARATSPLRDPPGNARIAHPMIASPYDVPPGAREGHMRFRFGLPRAVTEVLPQTAEQAVRPTEDGARIDVCGHCGSGLPSDPASLARWSRRTPWLQSDDPVIAEAARTARRVSQGDAETMAELARITRRRIPDVDFAGHYSAGAAWRRRAGDCTEDAVLLAALARAAGIPALVASGMVYTRERYHGTHDAFIPHSWTVAFVNGEWRSFDMTLGAFDSTHVALTLGEGDAQSVAAAYFIAGLLEWRDMAEVRPRPAGQVRLGDSPGASPGSSDRLADSSS